MCWLAPPYPWLWECASFAALISVPTIVYATFFFGDHVDRVVRVPVPEGAALGAAYFARMAAGLETSLEGSTRWSAVGRRIEPDPAWVEAAAVRYEKFSDLGTGAERPTRLG